MPMSTKIEDLPGPVQHHDTQQLDPPHNELHLQTQSTSNIKANIKKKVQFSDKIEQFGEDDNTFMSMLRSEFSEENLMILAALIVTALPSLSRHVKSIPLVGTYATSDFSTAVIKAILVFVCFILIKILVLPKIKL